MGCIMVDTIMLDLSGATDEEVDLLVEETEKQMRGKKEFMEMPQLEKAISPPLLVSTLPRPNRRT